MISELKNRTTNIRDFTIESPLIRKGEQPFNPERDISDEMWMHLNGVLRRYMDRVMRSGIRDSQTFLSIATNLSLLKGKRRQLHFHFGQEEWLTVDKDLEAMKKSGEYNTGYLNFLKNIHVFGRERGRDEKYQLPPRIAQGFGASEGAHVLACIKLVNPTYPIEVPDDYWRRLKRGVEVYRESSLPLANARNLVAFAAHLKILDQQKTNEILSDVKYPWDSLRQGLHEITTAGKTEGRTELGVVIEYSKFASELAFLAAKEIKMTDKGVELVMPEEKQDFIDPQPMPVRRSF